jgi:ATP-dependent protease ClpP protease subunit
MMMRCFFRIPVPLIVALMVAVLPPLANTNGLGETTIRVVPPSNKPFIERHHTREYLHIEIKGDIRRSAVPRLVTALAEAKRVAEHYTLSREPIINVSLNSQGGEILAAMQMGRLLRSNAAIVWVDNNAECSSACILVLAGGITRMAFTGAKLGIHRPFFQPEEFAELSHIEAQDRYNELLDKVRGYLSDMGISDSLFEAMVKIPSRRVKYLEEEFAEASRLLGDDPAYEEWQRAKQLKELGPERSEKFEQYNDCIKSGRPAKECSRFLSGW